MVCGRGEDGEQYVDGGWYVGGVRVVSSKWYVEGVRVVSGM